MNNAIKNRIEEINSGRVPDGYKKTPFGIFPCDWDNFSLAELSEVIDGDRGKNYPKENEFYENGFCLFLNAGNVTEKGFCFDNNQYITEEKNNRLRKGKLLDKDIVITTRGTVGNFALFSNEIQYRNIRINSGMAIIRQNNVANINYLFCSLKSFLVKNQIKKICFGSAQPQLTIPNIKGLQIGIPKHKTEQGKIAEILMKWDEMVELQEQYITKLETRKKTLFSKLFNYKSKYIISMQDVIDKGYMRLIKPKELPYFDDERLYLSTSSIIQNKIVGDEGYITYSNRPSRAQMYPISNSVWFAKMENSIKVFKFNRDQQDRYILSTGYYGLLCDEEKIDSNYLMQNLLSPEFNRIKDLYSEGSSQNGIKDNNLSDILLVLPPMDEQKNIAKILSKADEEISLQKEKLEKIKAQRKILQQYLLTGIVRV